MHSVKVKRQELLDVVRKNREAHRDIFEKARVGYRRQAIAELDVMLADAKAGRIIRRAVGLIDGQFNLWPGQGFLQVGSCRRKNVRGLIQNRGDRAHTFR